MSLDNLIEECAAGGWLLNNLFQFDDGEWCANLRSADGRFTHFGKGPTAEVALGLTIAKIAQAEFSDQEGSAVVFYAEQRQSLLEQLGLMAKPEPVRRI